VAVLIVLMLIGVAATWRALTHDDPPPDDSALLAHWSERGGDNNPLAAFCREMAPHPIKAEYDRLGTEVRKFEPGTEAQVREFVQKFDSAFLSFDELMATDSASWQWPGGPKISNYDFSIQDSVPPVADVLQLLRMKVHVLSLDGKPEDAAKLAMKILRFARGLQHAEGGMIHTLVAITADAIGQLALRDAITGTSASPEFLRSCLDELRSLDGLQREDYQFTLRADYMGFKRTLERLERGEIKELSASDPQGIPFSKGFNFFLKANRTIATRCELSRPMVEALDHGWREGFLAAVASEKRADALFNNKKEPLQYLNANISGNLVNKMMWTANSKMMEKAVMVVIMHDQAETMLALRLCELGHGKLPGRLEELVPEFLANIPDDYFSGNHMSWDATSRVLYSVGSNQKDDGGAVIEDRPTKGDDLGMRYWWSPKEAVASPK
jgi:hypothetical protein